MSALGIVLVPVAVVMARVLVGIRHSGRRRPPLAVVESKRRRS